MCGLTFVYWQARMPHRLIKNRRAEYAIIFVYHIPISWDKLVSLDLEAIQADQLTSAEFRLMISAPTSTRWMSASRVSLSIDRCRSSKPRTLMVRSNNNNKLSRSIIPVYSTSARLRPHRDLISSESHQRQSGQADLELGYTNIFDDMSSGLIYLSTLSRYIPTH